jgi:hypothetical protein
MGGTAEGLGYGEAQVAGCAYDEDFWHGCECLGMDVFIVLNKLWDLLRRL